MSDDSTFRGPTSRLDAGAAGLLRSLWLVLLPALAAATFLRYLVPTPAEAHGTVGERAVSMVDGHGFALGLGLFVLLSTLAHYFGAWLPAAPPREPSRGWRGALAPTALVVVALASALLLRSSFGAYRVLSASMLPTLEPGDFVAGRRHAFVSPSGGSAEISRGDLVVFRKPALVDGPELLVKRVLGVPGDRISMNGNQPVINGWPVPQCDAGPYFYPITEGGGVAARLHVEFLNGRAYLALYAPMERVWTGPYDVKPGELFLLGDNRANSMDSRAWAGGTGAGLPVAEVEAKVSRWLFGYQLDDHVDLRNLWRKNFETEPRLLSLDSAGMRDRIQRCLVQPPQDTRPPEAHGS